MGISGMSPGSLIILFLLALLVFGPKRLASLGHELGSAIRQFKRALEEDESADEERSV